MEERILPWELLAYLIGAKSTVRHQSMTEKLHTAVHYRYPELTLLSRRLAGEVEVEEAVEWESIYASYGRFSCCFCVTLQLAAFLQNPGLEAPLVQVTAHGGEEIGQDCTYLPVVALGMSGVGGYVDELTRA